MSGSFSFIVLDRKSQCMFSLQKSDNLQYNTLGPWVNCLIDQASDGQSIILIHRKWNSGLLAWT